MTTTKAKCRKHCRPTKGIHTSGCPRAGFAPKPAEPLKRVGWDESRKSPKPAEPVCCMCGMEESWHKGSMHGFRPTPDYAAAYAALMAWPGRGKK